MSIKPLGERVLIKMAKAETKTASGLFIPDTASQEKTQTGVIEALGDKVEGVVKVGQTVMYDKYAGSAVSFGDDEFLIVKLEEVIAIVG